MRRPKPQQPIAFPLLLAELAIASWETIAHRSLLIAQGVCSPAEYERMISEKWEAAHRSGLALAFSGGGDAMLAAMAPWHARAMANARRLRKV